VKHGPALDLTTLEPQAVAHWQLLIRGAVQGVGFRPLVYRLATGLGLEGWVSNTAQGVIVDLEGPRGRIESFQAQLVAEPPPQARIQSVEITRLHPVGVHGFTIRPSLESGPRTAVVLPDIAPCADCLRELRDPADRRYRYPFINCTNCGPRFSIIQGMPYDRAATTMGGFTMCPACQAEYDDPLDRRFHAQPNACPRCGPHLELWDHAGQTLARRDEALLMAADAIGKGAIVALKGVGGFQLLADARNERAVRQLRERKRREAKPFALMYPSLAMAEADCAVSEAEARLLCGPEAPIVLLRRAASGGRIAGPVAPGSPSLGVMLPSTPLHQLLLAELGSPIVATSGNRSDEPICTDELAALERLAGIADVFLVHNRPIARHVDDSVVRVALGRELVLRRARGYAPLPIRLGNAGPAVATLAVGAQQKNTLALAVGGDAVLSQHIGDLETTQAQAAFEQAAANLADLYGVAPVALAHDMHPDYAATQWARARAARASPHGCAPPALVPVQHHYAHILACMAENGLEAPLLGVAWDGTGYGPDGTVWGGEFLLVREGGWERVAHLRQFALPGGELAVREPRRAALSLCHEIDGAEAFEPERARICQAFSPLELRVLRSMLERGLNAPRTSSAGRLFDGVAALLGLRSVAQFEGQAAMELEWAVGPAITDSAYPFRLVGARAPLVIDWELALRALLADLARGAPRELIAARFHNTLVEAIVAVAEQVGMEAVALSGGCFQNLYLLERSVSRLRQAGFQVYWHRQVPPNDGGIALGQLVAAARQQAAQRQEGQTDVSRSARPAHQHHG
jgi:hydrogenase maturation protein HypF